MEMKIKPLLCCVGIGIGTSSLIYKLYLLVKEQLLKKKVYINGISSCFPSNCYSQNQMKDMFIKTYCQGEENLSSKDLDFINRVFAAALIEKCYVDLNETELFAQMDRERYTEYVKKSMLSMSCKAAENAIRNCNGLKKAQITHVVYGTMTSTIAAPSIDILISRELSLNSNVKRLNVESMGCLTGFRLVGLCRDIALQSEDNIILLIVCDIRSALGNQLTPFHCNQPIDKSNVIVAALFRNGCGAAIISQKRCFNHFFSIVDHQSLVAENTLPLARLRELNGSAIHLYLDKKLPYAVFDHVPAMVHQLMCKYNITIDLCQFAVHTGGPKVIRGIKECLNLQDEQLCASWYVMINYGNLSGTSNLVVVEHLYKWKYSSVKPTDHDLARIKFPKNFDKYKYVVGLSFGPGVGIECVLFELE